MTNSFNDIRHAKTQIIWGGNPAEAHPVSLQHLLEEEDAHGRTAPSQPQPTILAGQ